MEGLGDSLIIYEVQTTHPISLVSFDRTVMAAIILVCGYRRSVEDVPTISWRRSFGDRLYLDRLRLRHLCCSRFINGKHATVKCVARLASDFSPFIAYKVSHVGGQGGGGLL